MNQVTHNNHYVPQLYLKQWANDDRKLWAYRILVSHDNVPEWQLRSIRQVAYVPDLYTEIENGKDIDEFEKWLEAEFENPVQESIRKVLKDNPLSVLDWERLASFLGAQDIRTPQSYIESTERWKKTLPNLMQTILDEGVRKLEQKENFDDISKNPIDDVELFDSVLDVQVVPGNESDTGESYIQTGLTVGRKFWLQSQRYTLSKWITALKNHKWSIIRPARGYEWFTSDHPVVKLNDYGEGNYDLKGGWARNGGYIFMPLSPRHLLFTQIGYDFPERFTFSTDQTKQIQYLLAERALRWIFAQKRIPVIKQMRPRQIDTNAFKNEEEQWKNWHKLQKRAEESKK